MGIFNKIFGAVLVSDETIKSEFGYREIDRPARCSKCSKMYPIGHKFVWMPVSAHFFDYSGKNTREEWAVLAKQSDHRSGWCIDCVKKL